jgi:hypothetical protein
MLKKPHRSIPMGWESSPKDIEGKKYGMEGSRKEEAFDRKQMPKMPKMPMKK